MKWLFPVIIVLAIYLFLRGHDLPVAGGVVPGQPVEFRKPLVVAIGQRAPAIGAVPGE